MFLANTVPLVLQQAAYFQKHLSLSCKPQDKMVSYFIGDMNVDLWDTEQWKKAIDGCHVMVLTAQVFKDILNKHIRFQDIVLLVMDECHHVGKSHPMNEVRSCI